MGDIAVPCALRPTLWPRLRRWMDNDGTGHTATIERIVLVQVATHLVYLLRTRYLRSGSSATTERSLSGFPIHAGLTYQPGLINDTEPSNRPTNKVSCIRICNAPTKDEAIKRKTYRRDKTRLRKRPSPPSNLLQNSRRLHEGGASSGGSSYVRMGGARPGCVDRTIRDRLARVVAIDTIGLFFPK